jgi:RNA polymerase sigma factor (sigma-70 family)
VTAADLTDTAAVFGKRHRVLAEEATRRRFEAAVEPLMPDLLRYFARRVVPKADAADCLSETLLALWKHRNRLPATVDQQRAWAYGIARKILANHHRKRVRRHALDADLSTALANHAPQMPEAAHAAAQALALLPEKDRELIRLVIWDGFAIAGAGQILGMKAATARSRYARARRKLQEHLTAR